MREFVGWVVSRGYQKVRIEIDETDYVVTPELVAGLLQENFNPAKADWECEAMDVEEIGVCKAVQHSDQMVCLKCNLRWDMNNPYPPECKGE